MANTKGYVVKGLVNEFYNSTESNKKATDCAICGKRIFKGEGKRHVGYNGGFVCSDCEPQTIRYHGGSDKSVGSDIADNWQVSLEVEVEKSIHSNEPRVLAQVADTMVLKFGYTMESDITVWREFTGRIDHNMNGTAQVLQNLRRWHILGWLTTEPENVGTHCNISNDFVRNHKWSSNDIDYELIAQKSIDVLASHTTESTVVFGRGCGQWASRWAGDHTSAINTQHLTEAKKATTRFEFRIMKFHSGHDKGGNYYISGVQTWKKWVHTLEVCYNKGWSSERIAEKCAKVLLKELETKCNKAMEANDGWFEFVLGEE